MAQRPAQFCSECGAPLGAGQRFCTNCGATMGEDANAPTVSASHTPPGGLPAGDLGAVTPQTPAILSAGASEAMPTQLAASSLPTLPDVGQPLLPPPPPAVGSNPQQANFAEFAPPPPSAPAYNPYVASAPGGPQTYAQPVSAPSYAPASNSVTPAPVPVYAQKPKRSHGCLITSIVLLFVLAAGIGGFFLLRPRPNANGAQQQQNRSTTTGNTANGGTTPTSNNGTTPTAGVSSSEQLGLKFTYGSVTITIVSAQLASNFPDDTSTSGSTGVVRVNLHEDNTTTGNPYYVISESMLLVLPDGSTLQPDNTEQGVSPAAGVSRANWVDFPLKNQVTLSQLVLRVGQASENQMTIPLRPGADISKYQDKTSSPNAQFQYAGVNWTLKTATLSYSYVDQQATTGNLYVILNLAAVNNTSNGFVNSPSSYMRLQANGTSAQPSGNSTIPVEINASATASGIVAFLMPQGATSFTLVMLGQPNNSPPIAQVTQNFQIQ